MTAKDMYKKTLKAQLLFILGVNIGLIYGRTHALGHPILFGALTGLLFSLHAFRKCTSDIYEIYRREEDLEKLTQKKDEDNDKLN